jgi:RNA-binding protein YhbY
MGSGSQDSGLLDDLERIVVRAAQNNGAIRMVLAAKADRITHYLLISANGMPDGLVKQVQERIDREQPHGLNLVRGLTADQYARNQESIEGKISSGAFRLLYDARPEILDEEWSQAVQRIPGVTGLVRVLYDTRPNYLFFIREGQGLDASTRIYQFAEQLEKTHLGAFDVKILLARQFSETKERMIAQHNGKTAVLYERE